MVLLSLQSRRYGGREGAGRLQETGKNRATDAGERMLSHVTG